MSAHTEGKLIVMEGPAPSLVDHGWRAVAYIGRKLMLATTRDAFFENSDSAANARRLAACWNAFEGVRTDAIESGAGLTAAEFYRERDALIEALRDACTLLEGWINTKCPLRHRAEHRADLAKKRALIAKYSPKVPA